MSAYTREVDWRYQRAMAVLDDGVGAVDFAMYAEIFEMELDETIEIFLEVASYMGVRLCVSEKAVVRH